MPGASSESLFASYLIISKIETNLWLIQRQPPEPSGGCARNVPGFPKAEVTLAPP